MKWRDANGNAQSFPGWWSYLCTIGELAVSERGIYACVLVPEVNVAALAIALGTHSNRTHSHQLPSDGDLVLIGDLNSNPDIYVRGLCLGVTQVYGQDLFSFQTHSNPRNKSPVTVMYPREWVKKNVTVIEFEDPPTWLGPSLRKVRKDQVNIAGSGFIVTRAACTIVGKKKKLINLAQEPCISSSNGQVRSVNDVLRIQGSHDVREFLALTKLRSSNSRNVKSRIEIWAGNIPHKLPPATSSVICVLSGTDLNLEEKAQRFMGQFAEPVLGKQHMPVHPDVAGVSESLLRAYEDLPNGLAFCGFKQQRNGALSNE